jgi:hypothetical protein
VTWIIREGLVKGRGLYWSGDPYNRGGCWRATPDRILKYDDWRTLCRIVGNLSDTRDCRIVRLRRDTLCEDRKLLTEIASYLEALGPRA